MGPIEKFDVLITGAARGIGKQIADDLTAKGHRAQTPSRLILDLSDIDSIKNFLLVNGDDPVDVLILNAGQNYPQSLEEMEIRNWDETQMVNATSSLLLIQHYAPKMAARGYGRIVAISSAYASRARFGRSAYSASKATLEAIVRSVAIEFADKGVIANCVSPGFALTDLTRQNNNESQISDLASKIPLKRLADPSEISYWVQALASIENTYVTGQTINVDGGMSCI